MKRRAPIHYRHLRKTYVAILRAAMTDDWEGVGRLQKQMPMQYRAICHLVVWQRRLCGAA